MHALAIPYVWRSTLHSHLTFPDIMQPGRPQLCRFWLACIASAMEMVAIGDAHHVLWPLVAFLWHYTWAAVPEPLRARLTAALQRLHQAAEAYTAALENGQCQDADLPFGAAMCTLCVTCVAWVLEGDDSFQAWRRGQSEAVELPHHCAGLDRPQPWDARCALTARTCQRGP